jgi:hypothetical protein
MATINVRSELEGFKRQFEVLLGSAVDCELFTKKSVIYSRFPSRRFAPPHQSVNQWEACMAGSGITIEPEPITTATESDAAIRRYDIVGKELLNSAGCPIIKTGGWSFNHCIKFRGDGITGAKNLFNRINKWALERRVFLQKLGIVRTASSSDTVRNLMLWADVVLAMAETMDTAMITPPKWYVQIRPNERVSVELWKRRSSHEFGAFGLSEIEQYEIGDDPEEIDSERPDFIGDSIAVIDALIELDSATKSSLKQDEVDDVEVNQVGTLTENDRSILTVMLDLKADKIQPRTGDEILGAVIAEKEVGDSKRAFENLQRLKLIQSKRGPSGGRYLTEHGVEIARKIKSRAD